MSDPSTSHVDWIKAESLAATAAAKAVYDKQQAAARGSTAKVPPELAVPLAEYPEVAYIDSEGMVADCSKAGARATIYAIFDKEHALQYVGMSRSINPSLRLHLARMPSKCHYVKKQPIFNLQPIFNSYALSVVVSFRVSRAIMHPLNSCKLPTQVAHVASPNRAVLQQVQDNWIADSGSPVPVRA
eukprot:1107959-Prorocentrum_minimum.AAC.8